MAETIAEIEEKINSLPKGCIVAKKIDGKSYLYQQYKQDGKTVSNFLTKGQSEIMKPQIEERRELQKKLRALKKNLPSQPVYKFKANAIFGQGLLDMAEPLRQAKEILTLKF